MSENIQDIWTSRYLNQVTGLLLRAVRNADTPLESRNSSFPTNPRQGKNMGNIFENVCVIHYEKIVCYRNDTTKPRWFINMSQQNE